MPKKTVFISSTYVDLKDYRRDVWDALKRFDVIVRGMEEFGARTTAPLETCLAEVEQSDVYVGIIAYRLGSIDSESKKPFTLLEYEQAVDQKKEILIYLADDAVAAFPPSVMDDDARARKRLAAFKSHLRENHTVDTFSTSEDLAHKLSRDFEKLFLIREPRKGQAHSREDAFAKSATSITEFLLTPKRYNGLEVLLGVSFIAPLFPASRELCRQFNLDYGFTVGAQVIVERPPGKHGLSGVREIYATGNKIDLLRALVPTKNVDLYAQLQFSEQDVARIQGEFLGRSYREFHDYEQDDPNEVYVSPEGKVIMLFTKPA